MQIWFVSHICLISLLSSKYLKWLYEVAWTFEATLNANNNLSTHHFFLVILFLRGRLSIERCQADLCEALQSSALAFLTQLHVSKLISNNKRDLNHNHKLVQEKIITALDILKYKDKGFTFATNYLRINGMPTLADFAKFSNFQGPDKTEMQIKWETFIASVIDFYSGSYRAVEFRRLFRGH